KLFVQCLCWLSWHLSYLFPLILKRFQHSPCFIRRQTYRFLCFINDLPQLRQLALGLLELQPVVSLFLSKEDIHYSRKATIEIFFISRIHIPCFDPPAFELLHLFRVLFPVSASRIRFSLLNYCPLYLEVIDPIGCYQRPELLFQLLQPNI